MALEKEVLPISPINAPISPPAARSLPSLPVQELPTPLNSDCLQFFLSGYIPSVVELLSNGFSYGFPLHYEGPQDSSCARNLPSATQNPQAVDTKLGKELAAQRIAGPFTSPPFPHFRISTLGLVPKKTEGEFRLIHHLSFPQGLSLNDGISSEFASVSYATVDAIRITRSVGPGCYMAKTDIKNAFQIIPIRPKDYNLLGICWRGLYYCDRCMPMGCSSSCKTFEIFSSVIEWIAQKKLHIDHILHLLDDFLIVSPNQDLCKGQLDLFLMLCHYLGIPVTNTTY